MAAPVCWRSPLGLAKRIRISPASSIRIPSTCQRAGMANLADTAETTKSSPSRSTIVTPMEERKLAAERRKAEREELEKLPEHLRHLDPKTREVIMNMRLPRSVQAVYLRPLRRTPTHGIPSCDLQLRSYSVRNLEFFADFAMRAAYYLNLAAKGPVPLPRITERWTVPRGNFIHKKSQENFERVTLRRLIQIQDGHPTAVQCWLGYLERKAYHGIGMKANVWDFEGLDVAERMDEQADKLDKEMEEHWSNFGMRANAATEEKMEELLGAKAFSQQIRPMEELIREPIEIKRS